MTQKERLWVVVAVIVSSITTYAASNYVRESATQMPVTNTIPEEIEVKGDRSGVIDKIDAMTLEISLQPVLGQDAEQVRVDLGSVALLQPGAPDLTGPNPTYATELPAKLDQFKVGDLVQLRYDAHDPRKIVSLIRVVPRYTIPPTSQ